MERALEVTRPELTLPNVEVVIVELESPIPDRGVTLVTDYQWNIAWIAGSLMANACLCYLLSLWLGTSL